ncbi:alpha/beta hydrolase [Tomitella biformata]|uniref:alpha/beta hydrolase n=1 Tax=Tomitella biformata TaxID=630403 RepID=UPI0004662A97|nr:alpha/beta hydrolase [Tomitella biformata]
MTCSQWSPDLLGAPFEARSIPLGPDPDGESEVSATLVRQLADQGESPAEPRRAVLYVHGFTDYFFQRHLAAHFVEHGIDFYALDLRKCGRSLHPGQTPHYISDLALYDRELEAAMKLIGPAETLLMAHSTGGLILPLWLDRLRRAGRAPRTLGITGLVLNSPWLDLQGPAFLRSVGTVAINTVGKVRPRTALPTELSSAYGDSLYAGAGGEWDYNLDWKPLSGFPVLAGWLSAVRQGQAELHRGLDIGVPSLVLRSARTHYSRKFGPDSSSADTVLDVRQIARWSGCLGDRNTTVPIDGALHDVFLSAPAARAAAFSEVDTWLADLERRNSNPTLQES